MNVAIPTRFNGPRDSANGGYSCGLLAAQIDGAARVRLFVPPPLDQPLVLREAGEGQVDLLHGETLVGSAWPADLDLDIPQAPDLETARRASEGYPGHRQHAYPTCFVCGPGRPAQDGLELYPGRVGDGPLMACPWRPAADTLDEKGFVRPEIVWSALDCPGYFAALPAGTAALLGELTAELYAPVPAAEELIVFTWPRGNEGRKHWGATAIADQSGRVLAASLSLWIILK